MKDNDFIMNSEVSHDDEVKMSPNDKILEVIVILFLAFLFIGIFIKIEFL